MGQEYFILSFVQLSFLFRTLTRSYKTCKYIYTLFKMTSKCSLRTSEVFKDICRIGAKKANFLDDLTYF